MVLERDGGVCQLCGAVAGDIVLGRRVRLTVDHIIPRSKGGSNEPDNLQAHCNVCNEGKGDSLPSPPEYITILTLLRRADKDVLWEVAEWLRGRLWK
jgi:5-methylcytosine-specific restriction endonuclease McrA